MHLSSAPLTFNMRRHCNHDSIYTHLPNTSKIKRGNTNEPSDTTKTSTVDDDGNTSGTVVHKNLISMTVVHCAMFVNRNLTNDDVIGVAGLGHLLDKDVHHAPKVMILALEQLRHPEEHLQQMKQTKKHTASTVN